MAGQAVVSETSCDCRGIIACEAHTMAQREAPPRHVRATRWDAILRLLPRPLRNPAILDEIDKQDKAMGGKGHFGAEFHYDAEGKPCTAKVIPPVRSIALGGE